MTQLVINDVVEYVPSTLYARAQDDSSSWTFGWRYTRQEGRDVRHEIVELSQSQLKEKLAWLDRHSDRLAESRKLVPLRPRKTWKAVVKVINDDGTVSLDIESGARSGVTIHERRVKVIDYDKVRELQSRQRDPAGMHPAASLAHTCHKVK